MTTPDPVEPMFGMLFVGVVFSMVGSLMLVEGRRRIGFVLCALGALYLAPPLVRIWIAGVMG